MKKQEYNRIHIMCDHDGEMYKQYAARQKARYGSGEPTGYSKAAFANTVTESIFADSGDDDRFIVAQIRNPPSAKQLCNARNLKMISRDDDR